MICVTVESEEARSIYNSGTLPSIVYLFLNLFILITRKTCNIYVFVNMFQYMSIYQYIALVQRQLVYRQKCIGLWSKEKNESVCFGCIYLCIAVHTYVYI